MELGWIMGGFFVFVTLIFIAIAFFLPEWVGITGKKAKEMVLEQRGDTPPEDKKKIAMSFLSTLIFFISLTLGFSSSVWAQEFFSEFTAPPGPPAWSLKASALTEPQIPGDRNESALSQQRFSISVPVNQVPTDPVLVSWKWGQLNIDTDQPLNTGAHVPSHLYDSEFGISYKHAESAKEFWGTNFSFGSASDQLFGSGKTSTLSATVFYSFSENPKGRWIWLVNDSNNRSFLNNVPIPGAAYIYYPSPDFLGVFGFPFVFMKWKWQDTWSAQALLGPTTYKVEIANMVHEPLQAYAALESSQQSFFRANRSDDDARLFYSESKAIVGLRSPISAQMQADVFAGLAFARSLDEEDNYKFDNSDKVLLENRYLLGAQVSARF